MYSVTCSSCSHVEKSVFARVGAVMVCPACKTPVQLRVEDVKRQVKLRTEGDEDLFKVLHVQHEEPVTLPAPAAPAAPMPELELHEDHAELAAEATRRADAVRKRKPKAQAIVTSKPGLTGGELAQHLADKRRNKTLAMGAGVGVAALIGVLILMNATGGGNTEPTQDSSKDGAVVIDPLNKDGSPATSKDATKDGSTTPPDSTKDKALATKDGGTPVVDPTKDKAVVIPPPATLRLPALPLGIDVWQPVNEPFRHTAASDRVLLINDVREPGDSGEQVFKAQVVSQGVASAVVSIALVNDEDRIYARFERPYFLIDGKSPRPMKLTIPSELWSGSTSVCWQVQPIDTHITNMKLLEDTLAELIKDPAETVLKVSAYNASNFQLHDAAFVIQGIDQAGQVASQWRLKFPKEVDARSWVKFEALLPKVKPASYTSWRVLGAGLPIGTEVAPPVIEHQPDPKERDPKEPVPPRTGRGLFDF